MPGPDRHQDTDPERAHGAPVGSQRMTDCFWCGEVFNYYVYGRCPHCNGSSGSDTL